MPKPRNLRLCDFCQMFDDIDSLGRIGDIDSIGNHLYDESDDDEDYDNEHRRSLYELAENVDCIMCSFVVSRLVPECYPEVPTRLSIPEPWIRLGPSALVPSARTKERLADVEHRDTDGDPIELVLQINMFYRTPVLGVPETVVGKSDDPLPTYTYSNATWVDLELTFHYDNNGNLEFISTWNTPYVELSSIKACMQRCQREHGQSCESVPEHLPRGFRLLDTYEMRVFEPETFTPFLALSYVWTSPLDAKNIQLSVANLQHFEGTDGINFAELPDTIADSIKICKALDERYLWVDRLCIIQDDATSKHHQICGMDRIYNAAKMTIICATNTEKVTGLPGAPGRSRQSFGRNQLRDSFLDKGEHKLRRCINNLLNRSTWNSRCWTFQEMLFSHRCLFFIDFEVFFNCSQMRWKEETGIDSLSDDDDQDVAFLNIKTFTRLPDYWKLVHAYTKKHLTYENDVLNAFTGIANKLSKTFDTRFWFGIPEAYLLPSLLWDPHYVAGKDNLVRKREGVPQIPSWSWAAWFGVFEYTSRDFLNFRPLANLVNPYTAEQDKSKLQPMDVREPILGYYGQNPLDMYTATGKDNVTSLWRSCPHNPWSPEIHKPFNARYHSIGQNNPGSLVFQSTVARVFINPADGTMGPYNSLVLSDLSGNPIGLVHYDERAAKIIGGPSPVIRTFVVLCAGYLFPFKLPSNPHWTPWVLAGLLVEKQDGVYRRLVPGVAYVQMSLWHKANPKWETVVLA